jgi:hypothetical protein
VGGQNNQNLSSEMVIVKVLNGQCHLRRGGSMSDASASWRAFTAELKYVVRGGSANSGTPISGKGLL